MAKRFQKQKRSSEAAGVQRFSSANTPSIDGWLFLLRVAIILAAGWWVFSPVLHGEWLWDDTWLITENALMRDPDAFWKIWFHPANNLVDYFPITVSVEWVEWQLWKTDTFGYHLINLILHLISSLLVWHLLSKFKLRLAWLGGLLFAIHPVTVESVAWISEVKNTLSLPPMLLAMCFYVDYEAHKNGRDYWLALGLFLIAMLGKTSMVMFPLVILLYAWWKRGRIGWNDFKASLPFFAISLGLGLVTIWFLHQHSFGEHKIVIGGFLAHAALAGLSTAFYFTNCIWPVGLAPMYPRWVIDPPSLLQFLPWPIFGAMIGWFWMNRASWGRHALLGLGFFLINLVPFMGLTIGSYMEFTWVMDHLLYLPLIGLIGVAVAGLEQATGKLSGFVRLSAGVGGTIVMVLLAMESHGYAAKFDKKETLYTYTIQRTPGAVPAHLNLGYYFFQTGRIEESIKEFQEVLKIAPENEVAHNDLGNAFDQMGRSSEALEQYKLALRSNSSNAVAYYNIGNGLLRTGQALEAIEQYQQALRVDPNYADALGNLGVAFFQLHRLPEAIEQYEKVVKVRPSDAENRSNLGVALMQEGRMAEAVGQFEQALQINPNLQGVREKLESARQQSLPAKN